MGLGRGEGPGAIATPGVASPSLLNVAAVGLGLGTLFGSVLSDLARPVVTGGVTLLVGWTWAFLPRVIRGDLFVPWWVLASLGLAMLDSFLVMTLAFGGPESIGSFFAGLIGVTVLGAIVWLPALVVTFIGVGIPILLARRWALAGRKGVRRGDFVVGCAAILGSGLGLSQAGYAAGAPYRSAVETREQEDIETGRPAVALDPARHPPNPVDMKFLYVSGVLGVLAGGAGAAGARVRRVDRT